jgi:hypothetical protein
MIRHYIHLGDIIKEFIKIFFPQSHLTFESPLSPEEILNNIKTNISWNEELYKYGARDIYTFSDFEGFSKNSFFRIRRIIKFGSNSFIPIVNGNIIQSEKGSIIDINISLQKKVRILSSIFYIFLIFGVFQSLTDPIDIILVGSIILFLFIIATTHVFFNIESKKVITFIDNLIENNIMPESTSSGEIKSRKSEIK